MRHGFGRIGCVLQAASQNAQFRNNDDKIGPVVGGSPTIYFMGVLRTARSAPKQFRCLDRFL
jgi:hypothetical protein